MADLKGSNLNNKSKQYLFKNKLPIAKKSKTKLLRETFLMLLIASIIILINYLLPSQEVLFNSFTENLINIYTNFLLLIQYIFDVLLTILILFSRITVVILIAGSLYRIYRILRKKTSRAIFRK